MSIARKAIIGALWSSGANYLSQGVGMLSVGILGRLLIEQDYGLFSTANSIKEFVFILSAFSFNLSIIQTQEARDRLYGTAFVLNIALAIISLVITALAIAGWSIAFRNMNATEVFVLISLTIINIANLFGQHFDAILQRNLEFKKVSLISFVMNLLNPVAAIICAWFGMGVWSLVAGQGAGALVFLLGGWLYAGWRVELAWSRDTARWLISQGWRFLSSRSLEVVYTELDKLVIKRMNSYDQVGIYDRAVQAARYPARVVTPAVINVALPVYAKLEEGSGQLSEAYNRVNFFLIRMLIPFGLIFLLAPDRFMVALLGAKWISTAPVLRILALYAVMHPLVEHLRVLLYSLGRPQDVAAVRIVQIVVYVPALILLTMSHGITGSAYAIVISIVVTFVAFVLRTRSHVDVRILSTILLPFGLAIVAGLLYLLLPVPDFASVWLALGTESAIILAVFVLLETLFEGRSIRTHLSWFRSTLRNPTSE